MWTQHRTVSGLPKKEEYYCEKSREIWSPELRSDKKTQQNIENLGLKNYANQYQMWYVREIKSQTTLCYEYNIVTINFIFLYVVICIKGQTLNGH